MTRTSNTEKLEILMKQRLSKRDVAKLLECGNSEALKKADEFREWFMQKYPDSPWYGIPTELFAKRYHINENRIIKFAEIEKKNADALAQQSAVSR